MKNINKILVIVIAIAVLVPTLTLAATMKAGEEISVKQGDKIEGNLYIAGGNVSIDRNIDGDLLAAGGRVIITEDVTEDIAVAGGSITILGDSGGDVRVAGGDILIAGNVAGELVVTGGTVTISHNVSIAKDLVAVGGQITINGTVEGNAEITGGVVTIGGHINGDVKAKIEDKLTVGDGAIIDGVLEYSARDAEHLSINDSAIVAGEIIFKNANISYKKEEAKSFIFAILGALTLLKLISLMLVSLILIWLFSDFSNSIVKTAENMPLQMIGIGFLVLILVPVASIILFTTLFGIPLALIAMLSYGLLVLISCIYAGVVVGAWVSKAVHKEDQIVVTWKNVIIGIILLTIIKIIPFIGWAVSLLVFLVTLGSITNIVYKKFWIER